MENKKITILCVDDDKNILSSLNRFFRRSGYEILLAGGGGEGLELLEQNKVDIVISDMRMPNMDGAEFLEKVAGSFPDIIRILLTGYSDLQSTIAAVNKGHIYSYVSKPWEEEFRLVIRRAIELKKLEFERKKLLVEVEEKNKMLSAFNISLEKEVKLRTEELESTVKLLEQANAELDDVENRSGAESGKVVYERHSRRVAETAIEIGKKMKLTQSQLSEVYMAALLHDVGKVNLKGGEGVNLIKMTKDQKKLYEEHPVEGENIIKSIKSWKRVGEFIRYHHEAYNGTGYPNGLSGEKIPLGARIIAVADYYDCLKEGFVFGEGLEEEHIIPQMSLQKGKILDEKIFNIFMGLLDNSAVKKEPVELRLGVDDLLPGMVLTRDLYNAHGTKLLSKGHKITVKLAGQIEKLQANSEVPFTFHVIHR